MTLSKTKTLKVKRRLEHTYSSAKRRGKDFNLDFDYLVNISKAIATLTIIPTAPRIFSIKIRTGILMNVFKVALI